MPTITEKGFGTLAKHAAKIRQLGKRVIDDIIEIGARLTECKKICGHGNWLSWLDREFGWSADTAERFIQVCALSEQIPQIAEFNLPISALYLLAAPSTPPEACDEIIERAQSGELISVNEVKQTIEAAKGGQQPLPQAEKRCPEIKISVVEHSLARLIGELIDEHGASIEGFLLDAIIQYAREVVADLCGTDDEEEERRFFQAVAVLEALDEEFNKQSAWEAAPLADDGMPPIPNFSQRGAAT